MSAAPVIQQDLRPLGRLGQHVNDMMTGTDDETDTGIISQRVQALRPFSTPDANDSPLQSQIKLGMKAACDMVAGYDHNWKRAKASFLRDIRALNRKVSRAVLHGIVAGFLFLGQAGQNAGALLERCLEQALAVVHNVQRWLQQEQIASQHFQQQRSDQGRIR